MTTKFSQLPKAATFDTANILLPAVLLGVSSNASTVLTGNTVKGYIISTIAGNVTTLQSQITDLQTANSAQNTTNSTVNSSLSSINSTLSTHTSQIGSLQSNSVTFASQISTLQTKSGGGIVNLVAATAPIVMGGNASYPTVTITQASTSTNGYLSSGDWNVFNNKAATASPTLTGTITTTGGTINAANISAGQVFPSANVTYGLGSTTAWWNGLYSTAATIGTVTAGSTSTGTLTVAGTTTAQHILPAANVSYNLGSTTAWWSTIYGVSTQAKYADLAELYLPDREYPVGTVMIIGGTAEVTACMPGYRAVGVISEKPAHLMNSQLEGGIAVALKGRVPVRVIGIVNKGDRLIAADNGTAIAGQGETFAIALASDINADEKLVEALVL